MAPAAALIAATLCVATNNHNGIACVSYDERFRSLCLEPDEQREDDLWPARVTQQTQFV